MILDTDDTLSDFTDDTLSECDVTNQENQSKVGRKQTAIRTYSEILLEYFGKHEHAKFYFKQTEKYCFSQKVQVVRSIEAS